jgi:hypothetical protein
LTTCVEEHLIHGFRSKCFIDFGSYDKNPIVVIDMVFQPLDGVSMYAAAYSAPPAYTNNTIAMPPRYSVDEKGAPATATSACAQHVEKVEEDTRGAGLNGWFYTKAKEEEEKNGVRASLIRGLLGRKVAFRPRCEKEDPGLGPTVC